MAKKISIAELEKIADKMRYDPESLAVAMGISSRQLLRRIRAETGLCTRDWLHVLQCRKVTELVKCGYSTKAAAEEARFPGDTQCCRIFKQMHGVSPQSVFSRSSSQPGKAPSRGKLPAGESSQPGRRSLENVCHCQ
jgi:AraC-like DNA-binding protein